MTSNPNPVLVVGGSLVGLSAAVFLAWRGVSTVLVDPHLGSSPHPRAVGYHRARWSCSARSVSVRRFRRCRPRQQVRAGPGWRAWPANGSRNHPGHRPRPVRITARQSPCSTTPPAPQRLSSRTASRRSCARRQPRSVLIYGWARHSPGSSRTRTGSPPGCMKTTAESTRCARPTSSRPTATAARFGSPSGSAAAAVGLSRPSAGPVPGLAR